MSTLWHNPQCSKSRAALDLLRAHGVEPTIRDYLAQPPGPDELHVLLRLLGIDAQQLVRSSDDDYAALGLEPSTGADALVQAMSAHPRLIQRPILVVGDRAVIGRPAERMLVLLQLLADSCDLPGQRLPTTTS